MLVSYPPPYGLPVEGKKGIISGLFKVDIGPGSKKKIWGVEVFPAFPSVFSAASTILTFVDMSNQVETQ